MYWIFGRMTSGSEITSFVIGIERSIKRVIGAGCARPPCGSMRLQLSVEEGGDIVQRDVLGQIRLADPS